MAEGKQHMSLTAFKKIPEAVALPALPPHDDEPAPDVLNEAEDVVLALKDVHFTVTSRRSRARFIQQRTQEQLANRTVKAGHSLTWPLQPLPLIITIPEGSCRDPVGTSLANWLQEGACSVPPKIEDLSCRSP